MDVKKKVRVDSLKKFDRFTFPDQTIENVVLNIYPDSGVITYVGTGRDNECIDSVLFHEEIYTSVPCELVRFDELEIGDSVFDENFPGETGIIITVNGKPAIYWESEYGAFTEEPDELFWRLP